MYTDTHTQSPMYSHKTPEMWVELLISFYIQEKKDTDRIKYRVKIQIP